MRNHFTYMALEVGNAKREQRKTGVVGEDGFFFYSMVLEALCLQFVT